MQTSFYWKNIQDKNKFIANEKQIGLVIEAYKLSTEDVATGQNTWTRDKIFIPDNESL